MKVLVIGSGGREHALAWRLSRSRRVKQVHCAPGNPGTAELGRNHPVPVDDIDGLIALARSERIDLVVVGPEVPLVMGIVDRFAALKIPCFGPTKAAAELEGSKVAMKQFLRKHNIPTAGFRVYDDPQTAHQAIDTGNLPIVVKCDGLAAGKGVTVATTAEEAHAAIKAIMVDHVFGVDAGRRVVIEEVLVGQEISVFAICDGHNAVMMDYAQDHKQLLDGDHGPNTGGMGAFTPAPGLLSRRDEDEVVQRILLPTLSGLVHEDRPFKGVLYLGLMVTDNGPRVLEYNVRFGDPECQPLMLRLQTDLVDVIEAVHQEKLDTVELSWQPETAICVTLASGGYPGGYPKGLPITGLDDDAVRKNATVFHAGTAMKGGELVTAGGRVLSVCALGDDLEHARTRAYAACDAIQFERKTLRRDIGLRAKAQP